MFILNFVGLLDLVGESATNIWFIGRQKGEERRKSRRTIAVRIVVLTEESARQRCRFLVAE